jgi:uncharacterized coiled-coil DUF342 family protein
MNYNGVPPSSYDGPLTPAEEYIRKADQIRNQIEETVTKIAALESERAKLDAEFSNAGVFGRGFLYSSYTQKSNTIADQLISLQKKRFELNSELNNLA